MAKNFNEFIDVLYSEEIMSKWDKMELDVQSEIEKEHVKDNELLNYAQLYNIRWTLFVVQQYHEWINS